MKHCLVLLLVVFAACNAPSPHFAGLDATRIAVAGSVFDVRLRGNLAEAVRVNPQYAPRFGPIRARAAFAMEQVSGCTVKEVRGDQALVLGVLDCGGPPVQRKYRIFPASYDCIELESWRSAGLRIAYTEFECSLY